MDEQMMDATIVDMCGWWSGGLEEVDGEAGRRLWMSLE